MTEKMLDKADRDLLEAHFRSIANIMLAKDILPQSNREFWNVEVGDCVYKFKVSAYEKKGSDTEKQYKKDMEQIRKAFNKEFGVEDG